MSIKYIQSTTQIQDIDYLHIPINSTSNNLALLGLVNPTSSILSVKNTNSIGYINSMDELPTGDDYSDYISTMKYSFYSLENKIAALGFRLYDLQQNQSIAVNSGTPTFNLVSISSWTAVNSITNNYIETFSNINTILSITAPTRLTSTESKVGIYFYLQPCFILKNKQKILWPNNSQPWQGILQYFNFKGSFLKTISAFSGSTLSNSIYAGSHLFIEPSTTTYTNSMSVNDIFTKNSNLSINYQGHLIGQNGGSYRFLKTNCKIGNSERNLPIVFINDIPGQEGDLSFKIDGLYKFWYSPGDTWIDFTSKPKTHNIGSHVSVEINGDVTYNDASLRDSSLTRHQLYVKNVNGTFTVVNSSDVINGDLYYTTYSS